MKWFIPALAFLALALLPASAHRLDEYLQAARIGISVNRIELALDLTPGADVAEELLKIIDAHDSPGISRAAGQRYAHRVLDDLRLELDGKPRSLKLTSAVFPERAAMREGEGTIRLRAVVDVPKLQPGHHEILFHNHHLPNLSVYLVNALRPGTEPIQILSQTRDELQKEYHLSFEVTRMGR